MAKLLTFGELILRIQAQEGTLFFDNDQCSYYLGGSELNVAITAQSLGLDTAVATLVPDNTLGRRLLDRLSKTQVDTEKIVTHHGPVATYFLEKGDTLRGDLVLARQMGALGTHEDYSFDWDSILDGVTHFHSSGITAGLSDYSRGQVLAAMILAKQKNVEISYDFNFRGNLWTMEEAKQAQTPLLEHIDTLFLGKGEIVSMLGAPDSLNDHSDVRNFLFDTFNFIKAVVSHRDTDNKYSLVAYTPEGILQSRSYPLGRVDRIGAGDSMAAAFLYGSTQKWPLQETLDFAAFAACLKQSLRGDQMELSFSEVDRFRSQFNQQGFWR